MKFHPRLVAISARLLVVCSAGATLVIRDRLHTRYPTPEKESAFLKNYSPQPVIEQFECNLPSSYAHPIESSAGRKFVTNKAEFESFFAMRSDKWMPLMNTLNGSHRTRGKVVPRGAGHNPSEARQLHPLITD